MSKFFLNKKINFEVSSRNAIPVVVGILILILLIFTITTKTKENKGNLSFNELNKELNDGNAPNKRFCISSHLDQSSLSQEERELQMDFLKESGTYWTRFDFEVLHLSKEGDHLNFSYFDSIIDGLKERNIAVVAILPQWGETADANYKKVISTPEKYGEYAAALAKYLDSKEIEFIIEIGNEPNDSGFWPNRNPGIYTLYLNSAYDAIKKVDQNIKVISGGIVMYNPTNAENGQYSAVKWLEGMYDGGLKSQDNYHKTPELHMDSFSVHVYSGQDKPTRHYDDIVKLTGVMKSHKDSTKISITEIGWTTGDDGNAENVSEEVQAESVTNFYKDISTDVNLINNIDIACYYSLMDSDEGDAAENNWGLVDEDYDPKQAFESFKAAVRDASNQSI